MKILLRVILVIGVVVSSHTFAGEARIATGTYDAGNGRFIQILDGGKARFGTSGRVVSGTYSVQGNSIAVESSVITIMGRIENGDIVIERPDIPFSPGTRFKRNASVSAAAERLATGTCDAGNGRFIQILEGGKARFGTSGRVVSGTYSVQGKSIALESSVVTVMGRIEGGDIVVEKPDIPFSPGTRFKCKPS